MGLLNPNRLLWALSIAILLAIYLRSRSRPTLEISSLLLFEEAAAPTTRVRHLRIDPLFWLEMALLGAITLAVAGLYVRTSSAAAQGRTRALVFDLAAGMGARDGSGTRLDAAKQQALAIVDAAPERDRFSVVGYALEAQMIHPETANRDAIRHAIEGLRSMAVPGRRAAQSAALMRARASGEVEFFADRKPPPAVVTDSGLSSGLHFHQSGSPADNLAIVSLDPGVANISKGRVVLRNFAAKPNMCELAVDNDGKQVFHQELILSPREQILVPFGPLTSGGLVHARILDQDALEADNDRYAYAPVESHAQVLVLSSDPTVRDDLARVLLAMNSNFIIATADPAQFKAAAAQQYDLVVMHDCYVPDVKAQSLLLVFPPTGSSKQIPGMRILGVAPAALMTNQGQVDSNAAPTTLGATRTVILPEWMTVKASGTAAGGHELLPLVGSGALPAGRFGMIAFDVRGHLLLDPDRLDALVATVDLVRDLTSPAGLRIVDTGAFQAVPAPADAKIVGPDGAAISPTRDQWGRLRIHPFQPGRYTIEFAGEKSNVYANYYDVSESDLNATATPSASAGQSASLAGFAPSPRRIQPLSALLIILALIAILLESVLLLRTANRWGMRHV